MTNRRTVTTLQQAQRGRQVALEKLWQRPLMFVAQAPTESSMRSLAGQVMSQVLLTYNHCTSLVRGRTIIVSYSWQNAEMPAPRNYKTALLSLSPFYESAAEIIQCIFWQSLAMVGLK